MVIALAFRFDRKVDLTMDAFGKRLLLHYVFREILKGGLQLRNRMEIPNKGTFALINNTAGSVFTSHSQEHSLCFSSRFLHLNVTQPLIG